MINVVDRGFLRGCIGGRGEVKCMYILHDLSQFGITPFLHLIGFHSLPFQLNKSEIHDPI
jgi:hypothetical protein